MPSRATAILPWIFLFLGVVFYIRSTMGRWAVRYLVRGVGLSSRTAGCVPVVGVGLATHPSHAGLLGCEAEGAVLVYGHGW
jgi:hypothetical protein